MTAIDRPPIPWHERDPCAMAAAEFLPSNCGRANADSVPAGWSTRRSSTGRSGGEGGPDKLASAARDVPLPRWSGGAPRMSIGSQMGMHVAGFIAAVLLGLLLAWGGSALSVAPAAAMSGTVVIVGGASEDAASDCAAHALPDDQAGDQHDHDEDRGHSSGSPHAGCCMMACSMLALEPGRLPMTSAAWTLARAAMVVNAPYDGRSISPPQRPPKAVA